MGWQPIDTAPKDETHILAVRAEAGHSPLPVAICWNPWVGAWCRNAGPDNPQPVVHQPTHWMPLPEPPLAALQAGG